MVLDDPATTIERRFDVMTDISREWFETFVTQLATSWGPKSDLRGYVRVRADSDDRVEFRSDKAWKQYVLTRWDDVVETELWIYVGKIRHVVCDHRLHSLVLGVSGAGEPEIEQTFGVLAGMLSLASSPPTAYQYRRSSIEFDIGDWRPNAFVAGIKQIAALIGGNPHVAEAYAKSFEGDIEKLTPFSTLRDFCSTVGTAASRFGEVAIRMQARSVGIGIGVTSDHKKLRIRTSLAPDEVDGLVQAWPEALHLKTIKATDTGAEVAGSAPPPSEQPILKHGVPVLIAFITAVSTAGVVTMKKAVWPDYKVMVRSPPVENGVAHWAGNVLPVSWYVQPEQASLRAAQNDAPAEVRLLNASGSPQQQKGKPPLTFNVEPGRYIVLIDAPNAMPANFQLVVDTTDTR